MYRGFIVHQSDFTFRGNAADLGQRHHGYAITLQPNYLGDDVFMSSQRGSYLAKRAERGVQAN